jgi:glycerol uptake facilitator-like aquaporin
MDAGLYLVAQVAGAVAGVVAAHAMFDLALLQTSDTARSGLAQGFSEWVATFGLVVTILLTLRAKPDAVATSVGLYITAAYWFTASTSFANPAVTLARAFSDTFAGIDLTDVPLFIAAQILGAVAALGVVRFLADPPIDAQSRSLPEAAEEKS